MKLILFDIDGTLLKSTNTIHVESYSYAIRSVFGIEGHLYDIVPDGKVDSQIFLEILRHGGIPQKLVRQHINELFLARHEFVVQNMQDSQVNDVLPGVDCLLTILKKHFVLGIVTGNEEQSAWHRLEKAGLKHFFLTGGFGNESERRADLVKIAIQRAERMANQQFSPSDVLLVGDTPNDVRCAKENNLRIIAVATGRYGTQELQGTEADIVLVDLTHISEFEHFIG
jgi:phosphoglycolate phosphatase